MNTNSCKHCGMEIPVESDYCPFCGKAVDKKRICPKCGKEVEGDFTFCPYCGDSLEVSSNLKEFAKTVISPSTDKETTESKRKKRTLTPKIKVVILIIVVLVLSLLGMGYSIMRCYTLADAGQFTEANKFYIKPLFTMIDPLFIAYMDAGLLYEEGKYNEAIECFTNLKSYRESEQQIIWINAAIKQQLLEYHYKGEAAYNSGDYATAIDYFLKTGYDMDYLMLCYSHYYPDLDLTDTPVGLDAASVRKRLSTDLSNKYIEGEWRTSDYALYLDVYQAEGTMSYTQHIYFDTNVPNYTAYEYMITDNCIYAGIGIYKKSSISFEVVSWNEVIIYCHSDGSTYRMIRR